jgi:hypothetical protein
MHGVPIQVWSTKSFVSRWSGVLPARDTSRLVPDETITSRTLSGTVTNPFDVPLEPCDLYFGEIVYSLGKLGPGETATIERGRDFNMAQTHLRNPVVQRQKDFSRVIVTQFDANTLSVPDIVTTMMFYKLGGGKEVTAQLDHDYQGFVDASRILEAGQAILVGQGPMSSAATLTNGGEPLENDQDRRFSFYRAILPVGVVESN